MTAMRSDRDADSFGGTSIRMDAQDLDCLDSFHRLAKHIVRLLKEEKV